MMLCTDNRLRVPPGGGRRGSSKLEMKSGIISVLGQT